VSESNGSVSRSASGRSGGRSIAAREDDPMMPASKDSVDMNTMAEPELLIFAVRYLEKVKAHPRMIEAVRRAALRLLDDVKEKAR